MLSILLLIVRLILPLQPVAIQARAGSISGVIRQPNGEPAKGLRVMAVEASPAGPSPTGATALLSSVTETNPEGRYRLEGLPPGRYYVMAGKLDTPVYFPGVIGTARATLVNVTAGSTTADVDFPLILTTISLSGQVLFEAGIAPDAGRLTLRPHTPSSGRLRSQPPQATLSADGHFQFSNVTAGVYSIEYSEESGANSLSPFGYFGGGIALFPKTITIDEVVPELVIQVLRMHEVSGAITVEGGGQAPPFELVFAGRFNTEVKANGTFEAQLPAGEYRLSAKNLPRGFTLKSFRTNAGATSSGTEASLALTVPGPASFVNVTLAANTPSPWGKVSGHVSGAGGVQGLSVVLTEKPGMFVRQRGLIVDSWMAPVDTAGNFEFPRVLPGTYIAELSAGPDIPLDVSTTEPVDGIVVGESAKGPADVTTVRFTVPAQKEIRGRVEVEGGGPIPNFLLRMTTGPFDTSSVAFVRPNRDGRFTLTLAAGERTVDEVAGLSEDYEIRYGGADIEEGSTFNVDAKDTAELRVRMRSPESKQVRVSGRTEDITRDVLSSGGLRATLTSAAYAGVLETAVRSDGTFAFPEVFPGSYIVRITGSRVSTDICAAVTIGNTETQSVTVGRAREIELLSAQYDDHFDPEDVMEEVSRLIQPGRDEFFPAPDWLTAPPSSRVTTLAIRYQFACREFSLKTALPNPVSSAILKAHAQNVMIREHWNGPSIAIDDDADSKTQQRSIPVANNDIVVLAAFYGAKDAFVNVTEKMRDLLATGAQIFPVTDSLFGAPDRNDRILLLTYLYRGKRGTVQLGTGDEFSVSFLADTAEAGLQAGEYFSAQDFVSQGFRN